MKLKLLIVFLFTFNFLITLGQDYEIIQNTDGSKTFHEGKLEVKENMPFLTVKGDAYEMGLQYGVLMNEMLLDMDHTVDSLIDSYIGSFFLKKWIAGMVLNSKIKKVETTHCIAFYI